MIAEGVIICALWGGAILVAVDGAWVGSYIAANNDRPEGMPSYFADEREKEMYAMKVRRRVEGDAPSEEFADQDQQYVEMDARGARPGQDVTVLA